MKRTSKGYGQMHGVDNSCGQIMSRLDQIQKMGSWSNFDLKTLLINSNIDMICS